MRFGHLLMAVSACSILNACAGKSIDARHDLASSIAVQSSMSRSVINAEPFALTVYSKVTNSSTPARVYIEGDGLAWVGRGTPSLDPTPTNPVALRLAVRDDSENVIYIARPCQYTKITALGSGPCPMKYWTGHRFAPEVIEAFDDALDTLKNRYALKSFELVGFSGGAAVAGLVSAQREDVISFRSVAGNLDHGLVMQTHDVTPLYGSMDAVEVARQIAHIPQHHFVGEDDNVITPEVAKSFKQASGNPRCIRISTIKDATHEKGWSSNWPALLKFPIGCSKD